MSIVGDIVRNPAATTLRYRLLLSLGLVLVVGNLLALAAFAVRVDKVTTTTVQPLSRPVTVPTPASPGPEVAPVPALDASLAGPALSASEELNPTGEPTEPTTAPSRPAPAPPTPSTRPTSPGTDLGDGSTRIADCPIPIASSQTDGGLRSLIDFAPAFGPFTSEAFAAASAYQPLLQLIGPILAKYPEYADELEPVVTPFVATAQQLLNQGFAILGPLYLPYRNDFLKAETQAAAALAPLTQGLATSPIGGCVVALQNAVLNPGSR